MGEDCQGKSQGLEGALEVRRHQGFDHVCLCTQMEAGEVRVKGGNYMEYLFRAMVIEDRGFCSDLAIELRI